MRRGGVDPISHSKEIVMNRQREIPREPSVSQARALLVDRERADFMDFGLGDYAGILALQEALRLQRQVDAIPDTWLFGEHPAVITQGVRGQAGDLVRGGGERAQLPVVQIDRGGMTTLHSPGQMILYTISKLQGGSLAAGRMARALLTGLQAWLLETHGVDADIPDGRPGLFVGGRKLMSVGISARGGVSMHGIAMNLNNDLSLWSHIVACGEPGTRPITLSELLGREVTPRQQRDSIREWLAPAWGYAVVVERSPTSGEGLNP